MMSSEEQKTLVQRLREQDWPEAADRIEELEAELRDLRASVRAIPANEARAPFYGDEFEYDQADDPNVEFEPVSPEHEEIAIEPRFLLTTPTELEVGSILWTKGDGYFQVIKKGARADEYVVRRHELEEDQSFHPLITYVITVTTHE